MTRIATNGNARISVLIYILANGNSTNRHNILFSLFCAPFHHLIRLLRLFKPKQMFRLHLIVELHPFRVHIQLAALSLDSLNWVLFHSIHQMRCTCSENEIHISPSTRALTFSCCLAIEWEFCRTRTHRVWVPRKSLPPKRTIVWLNGVAMLDTARLCIMPKRWRSDRRKSIFIRQTLGSDILAKHSNVQNSICFAAARLVDNDADELTSIATRFHRCVQASGCACECAQVKRNKIECKENEDEVTEARRNATNCLHVVRRMCLLATRVSLSPPKPSSTFCWSERLHCVRIGISSKLRSQSIRKDASDAKRKRNVTDVVTQSQPKHRALRQFSRIQTKRHTKQGLTKLTQAQ